MSKHIFLHVWSTHSDTIEICNPGNVASDYRYIDSFHSRIQKVLSEGSNSATLTIFFRGERIQIPLKAGQHWPASETPFNSLIALRIVRISGGPDPLSPSGSAHAFEHPTYIGGGVGGWGVSVIQKTLNPLHVHRLRKCLDAFHNDYRGRKQNLLVKRAWILGN